MSKWTDQWRDFVRETSYMHHLKEEKISNDEFWSGYGIYDQVLLHSGYPGGILRRVSSFIPLGSTFLDIGAGTGAFSVPISRRTIETIAVEPSIFQLQILSEKARQEGLTNITTIEKEWKDVEQSEVSEVDYSLAAYSLFEEDIEKFLQKMIGITKKGIFIVFRANCIDSLSEFAFGPGPSADYLCLYHILKDMGYQFDVIIFSRNYSLPLNFVFKQYRFSKRDHEELTGFLRSQGRLQERTDEAYATFSEKDALLYLTR